MVKAIILLGVTALAAIAVRKGAALIAHSDALPLSSVVVSGVPVDSPRAREVLAYADLAPATPFLGIDLDAVARRVGRHPWIAQATVRRIPPDGLEIAIEERAVAAFVRVGGDFYLVDDTGEVMKRAESADAVDAPVVVLAEGTPDAATVGPAVALVRAYDRAQIPVSLSEVVVLPRVGMELVLDDGMRVRIGLDQFDAKLKKLRWVMERLTHAHRSASFVYLDDAQRPERIAVRLRSTSETKSTGG